ncbi:MAG: hypothetical protein ACRCW2_13360 [Cellulosilyticaceae bacterium]
MHDHHLDNETLLPEAGFWNAAQAKLNTRMTLALMRL